jgi:T6SS, Phospholipase effector Tle1-like, catalytic domain
MGMKRIVILIDGTWDDIHANTNLAKLSALIKGKANGTAQKVFYRAGVGTQGGWLRRLLGLWIGFGLRSLIQECYKIIAENFEAGDEIYIFGFSRGAYAARALAGMIGASGIHAHFEPTWNHYRVKPEVRKGKQAPDSKPSRIKCVGVWDTVGAYGIPAGFGFESLARYFRFSCSDSMTPVLAVTLMLAYMPLQWTNAVESSCPPSGQCQKVKLLGVTSSRLGLQVCTTMWGAVVPTLVCRMLRSSG